MHRTVAANPAIGCVHSDTGPLLAAGEVNCCILWQDSAGSSNAAVYVQMYFLFNCNPTPLIR